ncbi:hypothetical protein PAMP_020565 [Pampus punctatissimus]
MRKGGEVALSGVPLGALTLGVYTSATICGASGGSYPCHPDHAYGEESDKILGRVLGQGKQTEEKGGGSKRKRGL